ncbi:unnamed protein product [Orchesella dallaii]|uniref:Uncharacterized protein n=1 Tax=Orchesella dallaii TaxID=48710 RepID=A0ABP1RMX2_9HEXA
MENVQDFDSTISNPFHIRLPLLTDEEREFKDKVLLLNYVAYVWKENKKHAISVSNQTSAIHDSKEKSDEQLDTIIRYEATVTRLNGEIKALRKEVKKIKDETEVHKKEIDEVKKLLEQYEGEQKRTENVDEQVGSENSHDQPKPQEQMNTHEGEDGQNTSSSPISTENTSASVGQPPEQIQNVELRVEVEAEAKVHNPDPGELPVRASRRARAPRASEIPPMRTSTRPKAAIPKRYQK